MYQMLRERGACLAMPLFALFLLTVFLVLPASAYSIRIDDPITEVHYDVLGPDGSVVLSDQNSSDIANLDADGHYTILLHTDPLRITSDPESFLENMMNYSYAIIFAAFLVFLAGGVAGTFLSVFVRRRA